MFKYFFVTVFIFLFTSCQHTTTPEPQSQIVLGDNIEGVQIGDDSSTVVRKLGKPSYIGDGDMNGYIFQYTEGRLAYTFVTISKDPLFGLGTISVSLEGPYAGKTKDGIKIKCEREFVLGKIGVPDTSFAGSPLTYDIYYFNKNGFTFTYENQIVHRIIMSKPK
ncbi:MAG: hypothetical protein WCI84_00330 [Bacteroidota bacterium]